MVKIYPCSADGCTVNSFAKGYCQRHYMQVRTRGYTYKSFYDRKPILANGRMEYHLDEGVVIFDADFVPPKASIYISNHGYARFANEYAHRLVAGTPKGMETDHINHNKLDNRRANLRVCLPSQHGGNRPLSIKNKSGFLGVHRDRRRWAAQITVDGKVKHIGTFISGEEAARARDREAKKIYGDYANLNFKAVS